MLTCFCSFWSIIFCCLLILLPLLITPCHIDTWVTEQNHAYKWHCLPKDGNLVWTILDDSSASRYDLSILLFISIFFINLSDNYISSGTFSCYIYQSSNNYMSLNLLIRNKLQGFLMSLIKDLCYYQFC